MDKDAQLALLAAAVKAKLAYWDAVRTLETAVTGGDFSDVASDQVHDYIEMLAAGSSDDGSDVDVEHIDEVLKIVKDNP